MKPPIEKLYIYELKGRFSAKAGSPESGFIGCWNEGEYSYLFFSRPARGIVDELIAGGRNLRFLSTTELDYDQWEPADALKPFQVPPLSFVPAWMDSRESPLTIKLDPGVVFGAGTHHTTRKCLEFLSQLMKNEKIEVVVDIGTGTGVLAAAVARLGARKITAVDNNNLAVETARRNMELNSLSDIVECLVGEAGDYITSPADLVMANIITWVLMEIFRPGVELRARFYLISGIRGGEIDTFLARVAGLSLKILRREEENLWHTLLMENIRPGSE